MALRLFSIVIVYFPVIVMHFVVYLIPIVFLQENFLSKVAQTFGDFLGRSKKTTV